MLRSFALGRYPLFAATHATVCGRSAPPSSSKRRANVMTILTTVVGSYPQPAWLRVYPTRDSLRDATLVVARTQELAGIDVISDGELSRFDVNHPETNGMSVYFVKSLAGVRTACTRSDLEELRRQAGMGFRTRPAGVVQGKGGEGTLKRPAAWRCV